MKSVRIDYINGVNSRLDPCLLGDRYLLVADNVDTRSGVIKPVSAPEYDRAMSDSTERIFEYRGRWHSSTTRRDYAAELIGGQERVYYVDPAQRPMKIINGSDTPATLGIKRPDVGLLVEDYASIIPTGVVFGFNLNGGALIPGSYGYRIGYRTKHGFMKARTTEIATVSSEYPLAGISIEWSNPDFSFLPKDERPISIIIYGREIGRERFLAELTPDSTSYIDNGGAVPTGSFVSSYDATFPMRYCYTFERDVNGHIDESGPSALSVAANSSSARYITFNPADGFDSFTKTRNLYRMGDADSLSLVAKIPITRDRNHIATVSVAAGGAEYEVGDVLTVANGQDSDGTVTVTTVNGSGAVTGVSLTTAGSGYFVLNGLSTTGGHGYGCKINVLTLNADPETVLTYLDMLPLEALGGSPDSEYDDENGIHVVFGPAPVGLKRITPHSQMLFGIHGNKVRWTPINRPDAWPEEYCVNLPIAPVNLASFAGSMVILAQDALYRLDGWTPGGLTLTRMPIEDGCIAPYSVQKTSRGLLFLAARGLMCYTGGMTVEPITDKRLDPRVLIAPSRAKVEWAFWWLPTKASQPFAAQTRDYPTIDMNGIAPALDDTRVIDGPIDGIRSFVHEGKYYLYHTGANYSAGTTWVFDLSDPDIPLGATPISTMGLRPIDVHVTAMEQCYMLLPDFSSRNTILQELRDAQGNVDHTLASTVATTVDRCLSRWGKGRERIPWYIRTGPMSQGDPTKRKRYRYLEFHGTGTVNVRVYVDKRLVKEGQVQAVETPGHVRRLNLPRSSWGYSIDLEMAGSAEILAIETTLDGMPSES